MSTPNEPGGDPVSIADEARAEAERRYPATLHYDGDEFPNRDAGAQRQGWHERGEWEASRTPKAAPSGPAFIGQMPPSPETSRRHWSMYCRECGIEEYMADSADDAGLIAHRDEHNARMHAEAAPSCPTCRHAEHEGYQCLNMASDNDCACDKRATEAAPSDTDRTPEFEAVEQELFKHQPVMSMHDGGIAGCQCMDRVFHSRTEDWGTHLAEVFESLGFSRTPQPSAGTIPLYAMLDVWQALYGTSHPEFDEFYEKHGYAETWARLVAAVRTPQPSTVTEAQVEAALLTFWRAIDEDPVIDPEDLGAMRAALEAARLTPAQPEQVTEWEYARANRWGYVTEPDDDLADARRRAAGYPAGYKGGYQSVVRRRKAGPWEQVTPEGEKR